MEAAGSRKPQASMTKPLTLPIQSVIGFRPAGPATSVGVLSPTGRVANAMQATAPPFRATDEAIAAMRTGAARAVGVVSAPLRSFLPRGALRNQEPETPFTVAATALEGGQPFLQRQRSVRWADSCEAETPFTREAMTLEGGLASGYTVQAQPDQTPGGLSDASCKSRGPCHITLNVESTPAHLRRSISGRSVGTPTFRRSISGLSVPGSPTFARGSTLTTTSGPSYIALSSPQSPLSMNQTPNNVRFYV